MPSIRGRFYAAMQRRTSNINPFVHEDPAARIASLGNATLSEKLPKGIDVEWGELESGARYARTRPEGFERTGKMVFYLHGGGYITGLLPFYFNMTSKFARCANAETALLDYHLAPDFTYPAQLDEALAFWELVTGEWGFDPAGIVVGGDSAGGNLGLALMLKLRDAGEEMPAGGFFLSPWGDMTASGASYFDNYGADPQFGLKGEAITPEELDAYIHSSIYCWIGDADRSDPYVSPTLGDYHGFPPMLLCTGGTEMLLSDTLTIVDKCEAAGVPVQLDAPEGMFHIYATYDGFMPEGTRAWKMVEDFVARRLGV